MQLCSKGRDKVSRATYMVENGRSRYDFRYQEKVGGETLGNLEKSYFVVMLQSTEKMPIPSAKAWCPTKMQRLSDSLQFGRSHILYGGKFSVSSFLSMTSEMMNFYRSSCVCMVFSSMHISGQIRSNSSSVIFLKYGLPNISTILHLKGKALKHFRKWSLMF